MIRGAHFLDLPLDLYIAIFRHLDVQQLAALSRTCWVLHDLVSNTGWTTYTLAHPRPSLSLSTYIAHLPPQRHARFIHLTDREWSARTGIARPLTLGLYAVRDATPHMVVTPQRMVIAVANALHVYEFVGDKVRSRGEVKLHRNAGANEDVTGLGISGDSLIVGCANGKVLRVRLSEGEEPLKANVTAHYSHPPQHITSLSTSKWGSSAALALTATLGGTISLYHTKSPWVEPTRIVQEYPAAGTKQTRTWCSLIARSDSLAITGSTHISLHPILPSGLAPTSSSSTLPGPLKHSACYALSHGPNDHPELILSGWHDGLVRMYDLRSKDVPLTLRDPWSDSGVYCVGGGGGSGTHVVAGYSKHGMLAIFDIRSPSTAYTTYAPSSSLGPARPLNGFTQVSALHVEGSRIFGTTPHRAFVFDFGPDVTRDTYPFVNERRERMTDGGRGFMAQSYDHLVGLAR
ncbi:hypothetical protein BDV93DRAFT_520412 [Ceratobasidium sp. AG-I]|nr:hypothetical protein BDV93DRAFT_520412 [Ceratobasidium sp. AG-I]